MNDFAKASFMQYACGGMMTPEEQFMKIENALQHAAEIQAQQAESIARNESAIRDLIVVSRTLVDSQQGLVDSQQGLVDSHKDLAEAQRLQTEQMAAWDKKLRDASERAEEERKRDREEFNANFNALLLAQLETEQKLQRWIDRQNPSEPAS
jgi:hypothetical protein